MTLTRFAIFGTWLALAGAAPRRTAPPAQGARPRLVVVVVVDQMRADFLTRFAGLYRGGLARFLREGAVFTDAHHDHADTETSPGHATLATGAYPARHGIVANEWFDRTLNRTVYSVEDTTVSIVGRPGVEGRSPRRLLSNTLGDWLKRASPLSKVYSVAIKDRAAILMGGQRPDGVLWYDGAGQFVTSSYYAALPVWVDSFNLAGPARRVVGADWTKLLPEEAYFVSREDSFPTEYDGVHLTFPHALDTLTTGSPARSFAELPYTPFADQLVLRLAREIVARERLGADDAPDLLWISCSAGDYIGHRYGPLSQEAEDYYLRLDGFLAEFFSFLDQAVGARQYTMALSADHGAVPLPEELRRRGIAARRLMTQDVSAGLGQVDSTLAAELRINDRVIAGYSDGVLLHFSAARARGMDAAGLEGAVAARLRTLPYIADAYTAEELKAGRGAEREYFRLFRHSFYQGRSADVMIRFQPWYYLSPGKTGTGHGTPYPYDTQVPLVIAGVGARTGRHGGRVTTADLAPTLARILGVPPGSEVDGTVLDAALVGGS